MTSPSQVAGATTDAAAQAASAAKDEASQVTSTAASAAADVAGTAKEQVGQVAGEAVNQVKQLAGQAKQQVGAQAGDATTKLSESVRALAAELRELSQGKADGSGTAAGLAQQLADRGEQLAGYLSQQGPGGLVQELRSFAGRRPGGFLLGALAAGLTTGRVVKSATAAAHDETPTPPPYTPSGYVPPAADVRPVVEPYEPTPVYGNQSGLMGEDVTVVARASQPFPTGTGPR